MRLYYIANARMPTEKAHGIQIAKMCEAFMDLGIHLTLVVPARKNGAVRVEEFYGLHTSVEIVTLPAIDWYDRGRVGYTLSTLSFMFSYTRYVLKHVRRGDILYTVDLDHLAYAPLAWLRIPFFSEMHGGKPRTFIHQALFKKAAGIIATNTITRDQLKNTFHLNNDALIVEPNGVDFSKFTPLDKAESRAKLGIPQEKKLALYVGRFFDWKGLGILADTAPLLPESVYIGMVGGTQAEFKKVTGRDAPEKIVFFGEKPYTQIPLWAAAADALLVLGTKQDEQSYWYTSPMKVFEYMAMKRAIVASRTPALKNILTEQTCFFYEPDSAQSLAHAILEASESPDGNSRIEAAYTEVGQYAWSMRAKRIVSFMKERARINN